MSIKTVQSHWVRKHEKMTWKAPCFVPGCNRGLMEWDTYVHHVRNVHEHSQERVKGKKVTVRRNYDEQTKAELVKSHWWTWRLVENP